MSVGINSKDELYNALIDDFKARGLGTGVDGVSECQYILQVFGLLFQYITMFQFLQAVSFTKFHF